MTRLAAIVVAGDPSAWETTGFAVGAHGRIAFGNGAVACRDGERGVLLALAVDGLPGDHDHVDGVPIVRGTVTPGTDHPNGAFELDHVVVMTDSLERTSDAIASTLGLDCRRVRETDTVRQAFHRFDDQGGGRGCIVEVVETTGAERAELWGLVVNVADLDAAVGLIGSDRIATPKPAVQRGRRIATVRRSAGLGVPVALMSPAS